MKVDDYKDDNLWLMKGDCVDRIKDLGYEFKIHFDFNTKVIEKKVEVFPQMH